jgi:transcriptional regulator with XRE-family HTH domain
MVDQSLKDNVSRNMKELRKKRKLTQEALAGRTGLSLSYVSALELGRRIAPLPTVEKLAKALGVPAQRLLANP